MIIIYDNIETWRQANDLCNLEEQFIGTTNNYQSESLCKHPTKELWKFPIRTDILSQETITNLPKGIEVEQLTEDWTPNENS